mmetsp:Transcript_89965/g.253818  ORF Transcript_89965/g.253818 Transcript_89965/m.253818 type:complete len:241 (+) Transcript_89965:106-828(+)
MSTTVYGNGSDFNGHSWESLKARAKGLKAELDNKMQELGRLHKRLSQAGSSSSSPGDRAAALEGQIQLVVGLREEVERGLGQLEDASEAMSRIAATSTQSAQAVRFRETQQEMLRDFKRVSQSIEHQYQHARLLPGAKGGRGGAQTGDAEEGLMSERKGLNSALSMTDDVLEQASATRDMLGSQRNVLTGASSKLGGLETMLPGIGSLLGKITDRKNKEQVVLSFTVACCLFFTIWYKFL